MGGVELRRAAGHRLLEGPASCVANPSIPALCPGSRVWTRYARSR